MESFCSLFSDLQNTNNVKSKVARLLNYFKSTPPIDASWALYFILGNRLSKIFSSSQVKACCSKLTDLPDWLIEESILETSDLAETISLLLKPQLCCSGTPSISLSRYISNLIKLSDLEKEDKESELISLWKQGDFISTLILNKLILGPLRFDIKPQNIIEVLAELANLPISTIAARLNKKWIANEENFLSLISAHSELESQAIRPTNFQQIQKTADTPDLAGDLNSYLIEWKNTSLRVQLVLSASSCLIWTEDQKDISRSFPEIVSEAISLLPINTIIEGELSEVSNRFELFKKRILTKQPSKKLILEIPALFKVTDLIYYGGQDFSAFSLLERKIKLDEIISQSNCKILASPLAIKCKDWEQLVEIRKNADKQCHTAIQIRSLSAPYHDSLSQNVRIEWELEPFQANAILIYVEGAPSRDLSNIREFTFAAWRDNQLLPISKISYSDSDIDTEFILEFISKNTVEKFGPVKSIKPRLVFEISFKGVAESSRHKSGLVLKDAKIIRLAKETLPENAVKLDQIRSLLSRS